MSGAAFGLRVGRMVAADGLEAPPLNRGFRFKTFYRVANGCVVVLVLQRSRGRATASWWIGRSFNWGWVPRGVPFVAAYQRVAGLLTIDERREFFGAETTAIVGGDYWWPDSSRGSQDGLLTVVHLTLPRFLEAAPYRELSRSLEWNERCRRLSAIAAAVEPTTGRPSMADLAPAHAAPWHDAAFRLGFAKSKSDAVALGEDAALSRAAGVLD